MEFGHNGGTIGRSLESDWVLPDGQRYLSSRHASIDFRSGSYYVVDTSTNGVYVNDGEQPVGRGNPQRLFTGDRIRIGEYEMSVEITDEDDTRETLTDDRHVDPVSKAQRVPPPDPTRADMVAPHEITAVGIEMLISEEVEIGQIQRMQQSERREPAPRGGRRREPSRSTAAAQPSGPSLRPRPPPRSVAEPPPVSAAARVTRSAPRRHRPAAETGGDARPYQSRLRPRRRRPRPRRRRRSTRSSAAPACRRQRLDDKQAEQVLHRLGQLMREVVLGVTENLHLRAEQKNVLRVPTTTIQPQNNNPLKFSASVEEALNNLLFRDSAEYLSAVDAVRETFGDIKQHQQHMLAAVRTAVVDYVGRLDPEELESKVSNGRARRADQCRQQAEVLGSIQGSLPGRVAAPTGPVPAAVHRGAGARLRARRVARGFAGSHRAQAEARLASRSRNVPRYRGLCGRNSTIVRSSGLQG